MEKILNNAKNLRNKKIGKQTNKQKILTNNRL